MWCTLTEVNCELLRMASKEKIAVDKTFGLKNKNKSKVVQKSFVSTFP